MGPGKTCSNVGPPLFMMDMVNGRESISPTSGLGQGYWDQLLTFLVPG